MGDFFLTQSREGAKRGKKADGYGSDLFSWAALRFCGFAGLRGNSFRETRSVGPIKTSVGQG